MYYIFILLQGLFFSNASCFSWYVDKLQCLKIKKPWKVCDRLWIYTITNLLVFLKQSLDYWDEKFSLLGETKSTFNAPMLNMDKKSPEKMNCCEFNHWKLNNWLHTATASHSPVGKCSIKVSGLYCSKSAYFFNFINAI